jgi:hypothetical protein
MRIQTSREAMRTKRRKKYVDVQDLYEIRHPLVLRCHYNELQTAPIAIDHARKLLESITTKVKQPHFKAWRVKGMLDLENFSPNHTQPIIIIDLPKHCWVYTGTGEDGDFTYETQDLDVGLMVRMAKKAWVDLTPKASMLTASRPPIQADKLGIQKWLQHEVQKTTNPQETT